MRENFCREKLLNPRLRSLRVLLHLLLLLMHSPTSTLCVALLAVEGNFGVSLLSGAAEGADAWAEPSMDAA